MLVHRASWPTTPLHDHLRYRRGRRACHRLHDDAARVSCQSHFPTPYPAPLYRRHPAFSTSLITLPTRRARNHPDSSIYIPNTILTPHLSVVKTRMQSLDARSQYRGVLHCAYRIATEEGILRFWTGTGPRLVRLVVSTCSSLSLCMSWASPITEQVAPRKIGKRCTGEIQSLSDVAAAEECTTIVVSPLAILNLLFVVLI